MKLTVPVKRKAGPPQVDARPVDAPPLANGEARCIARGLPGAPMAKWVMTVGMDTGRDGTAIAVAHVQEGQVVIDEVKWIPSTCPAPDEVARATFYANMPQKVAAVPFWRKPHIWYSCEVGLHDECREQHLDACDCKTVVGLCSCTCHDNG